MRILKKHDPIKMDFDKNCESLCREQDLKLDKSTTKVAQEYNARGLLRSSLHVQGVYELHMQELRECSDLILQTTLDTVCANGKSPNTSKVSDWLSVALNKRKMSLEQRLQRHVSSLKAGLLNHTMVIPISTLNGSYPYLLERTLIRFRSKYDKYLRELRKAPRKRWRKLLYFFLIPPITLFNDYWDFIEKILQIKSYLIDVF